MKKLISLLIVIFMLITIFTSCNIDGEDGSKNDISEAESTSQSMEVETTAEIAQVVSTQSNEDAEKDLKNRTKKEYQAFLNNNFFNGEEKVGEYDVYLNDFNFSVKECVTVLGSYSTPQQEPYTENIAEYTITYPQMCPIHIYKDSKFYTIKEAYEQNLISSSAVFYISRRYNAKIILDINKYVIFYNEKDKASFDEELASEILIEYCYLDNNKIYPFTPWAPSDYYIGYEGSVEDGHIIKPINHNLDNDAMEHITKIEVAGYKINYDASHPLYYYKYGHFYTLENAYKSGVLSKAGVYEFGKRVDPDFAKNNPAP